MESRQLPSPSHDPTTPTHRLSVSGYQCTFHKKPQGSLRSAQSRLSLFRHAGSTDGSEPDSGIGPLHKLYKETEKKTL
ncbi:unnamed protein product [Nesidiocoris tenuis]|uniref:Uncharacterized protein n=1 Tax=Nesidiocoris tenuis TaxID=355587 RepID=A0A6H5GPR5_9HEMI|nr:unnamed protein product [Nesidiocoris tenuis]